MSSFIVSDAHVRELACFLASDTLDGLRRLCHVFELQDRNGKELHAAGFVEQDVVAEAIANILLQENWKAYNIRYREDGEPERLHVSLGDCTYRKVTDPATLAKMVSCFRYQCAEYDGYENSKAYRLTERVLDKIVEGLPGYDSAPWGYDDPEGTEPAPEVISLTALMTK